MYIGYPPPLCTNPMAPKICPYRGIIAKIQNIVYIGYPPLPYEIGRASCRERVFVCVLCGARGAVGSPIKKTWVSGVPGALTKSL